MRTAHLVQHGLTRLQSQMVGIIETEHAASLFELVVGQTLERGLSRDGHEDREGDVAMGEVQGARAGFCRLTELASHC